MTAAALTRTAALLGEAAMARLASAHILLLGLGGVGGHAFDALVRSGIGALTVVDFDTVAESNLNRQLLADRETLGKRKVDAASAHAARLTDTLRLITVPERLTADAVPALLASAPFSLVIDAIDDVPVKVAVAAEATARGIPILTCLGTGNRLDPTALHFTDIAKTAGCPLARAVRTRLRRVGVTHLRVLVSSEEPKKPLTDAVSIGSVAYVPAVAGLMLAGEAVRTLAKDGE